MARNEVGPSPDSERLRQRLLGADQTALVRMAFAGIDWIDHLLEKRQWLRAEKRFKEADDIRTLVESYGVEICDSAAGPATWSVRFLDEKATKRFVAWLDSQGAREARVWGEVEGARP